MELMTNFKETPSGIIVPSVSVRCSFCPRVIFSQGEALWTYDGLPVCTICRATKFTRFAKQIARDKWKYARDTKAREALKDTRENERVGNIAIESIKGSNTALNKTPRADRKRFTV